jgi:hypothetical protein
MPNDSILGMLREEAVEENGVDWQAWQHAQTGICWHCHVGACSRDIPVIMGAAERLGKWNLIFADFRRGIFWGDRFPSAIRSSDYVRNQSANGRGHSEETVRRMKCFQGFDKRM